MTFFADEGLDAAIVDALRQLSFEVIYAAEEYFAASDETLLHLAFQRNAILLTKDKDFGEMVVRQHLPTRGLVLIRIDELSLQPNVDFVVAAILKYVDDLTGSLLVIQEEKTRIRNL